MSLHEQLSDLYYEAHITIEPLYEDDLENLKNLVKPYNFRVADLFMQKRKEDRPERSKYDSFMTTRSKSYYDIKQRTEDCVKTLQENNYKIFRFKIEDTLIDVRFI